jgi:hypothetical protein
MEGYTYYRLDLSYSDHYPVLMKVGFWEQANLRIRNTSIQS